MKTLSCVEYASARHRRQTERTLYMPLRNDTLADLVGDNAEIPLAGRVGKSEEFRCLTPKLAVPAKPSSRCALSSSHSALASPLRTPSS